VKRRGINGLKAGRYVVCLSVHVDVLLIVITKTNQLGCWRR